MNFAADTRIAFDELADAAFAELQSGEELNLSLNAEDQTYLRFNDSKVRQATGVRQCHLGATYQRAGRRIEFNLDLTGAAGADLATLYSLLERARLEARVLPEDPFAIPMRNNGVSDNRHEGYPPSDAEIVDCLTARVAGAEVTGLFASGPQIRAVRNSAGQRHWFSTESSFLDYSLFTVNEAGENKAVKGLYADREWRREQLLRAIAESARQLQLLRRPSQAVAPGEYRVYLAPSAVADLVAMFSWGAVSYNAYRKGQSALRKLIDGEARLSERFTLLENFGLGLTQPFNSLGELPPHVVPVVANGELQNLLISSRSAKEYGVHGNFAEPNGSGGEYLRSAEMLPGDLPEAQALQALGTGLYLSNLHYLNWSDIRTARVTGMTRYACFWVEHGEPIAPIRDLRFDESLYRIFGSCLDAVTAESHVVPATDTYHHRALGGSKVPGILVDGFRFTL